jgi:O-antigen ligase
MGCADWIFPRRDRVYFHQGPNDRSSLRVCFSGCGPSGALSPHGLAQVDSSGFFGVAHNEVDTFTDILSARITDAGTTGTRLEEWKDALLEFTESPIIGKGVGFQLERTEFDETITAGYVHNQVVYTAMTMGIIGLGLYIFILSQWVRLLLRARFAAPQQKTLLAGCHACILSLLTYSLMFAGFRTIQHNYLLGVLLALTATLTPKFEAAAGD